MKPIFTALSLFLSCVCFSQTISKSFIFDGIERSYNIHIPDGYVEGESLPLVFNFHGFGSNGAQQEAYSGMSTIADNENFFVAYPNGIDDSWNVGWLVGSTADDVGFTNAMIDSIQSDYGIDLGRVYSCGMSNGGFFSYRLACELNSRINKIASVTGSMLESQANACTLESPIPVMQIHGTADPVVGYQGTLAISMPIEDLLSRWGTLNGCLETSDTLFIEDINSNDQSTAELIQHRSCDGDVYMAFYKIDNGGHTWPDAALNIGTTNRDFNASKEIWDFFNDQYPKDQVVDTEDLTFENTPVLVFPNPTQYLFNLQSSAEDIISVKAFDALGRLVFFKDEIQNTTYQIDASAWNAGMYVLMINRKDKTEVVSVVKSR